MPNESRPTRDRLLTAAGELFRRQGFAATGIKAVLAASDAPYGSLYHFFPGGKQQLGVEVIHEMGGAYHELVETYFPPAVDPVAATRTFFAEGADLVEQTGYADACPIASIALEIASTNEPMRAAAAAAFESWLAVLTDRLVGRGVDADAARACAVEIFCLVEGAFLLARTTRSVDAIRIAGVAAVESVKRAISGVDREEARAGARQSGSA